MKTYPFLLLLTIAGWAMLFCTPVIAENTLQLSEDHFNNLGVTLGKLEPARQIPLLTAPAKVVVPPTQEYIVTASQTGLITQLNVAVGDSVKKGDILAELNSSDLLTLQREYLKARSVLQLASDTYQRDKKLKDEGIIADRRWQETRNQYQSLTSEANEQRQLLEIAGMTDDDLNRLEKTHRLNSQLNVHSPITGVVMERVAIAGTRVDILAPIYHIANLDELWLEINIPHERIGNIKIGDQVLVENTPIRAEITLLGQSVNPENQTLLARATIKGKQSSVRVGQTINTRIIQATENAAFKVPNTAIAQNEGKAFIFIRNKEGFKVSPITVIGKQGEESIISGDLTGDEDIAIKGAVALKANWLGLGSAE